ncbi:uncharacterized protein [Bemisia tabaci]|uniref:uncharacterized protein n=1 Tax=Bemisia tabaci TaxID=7038 RepID=UPI003B2864D3
MTDMKTLNYLCLYVLLASCARGRSLYNISQDYSSFLYNISQDYSSFFNISQDYFNFFNISQDYSSFFNISQDYSSFFNISQDYSSFFNISQDYSSFLYNISQDYSGFSYNSSQDYSGFSYNSSQDYYGFLYNSSQGFSRGNNTGFEQFCLTLAAGLTNTTIYIPLVSLNLTNPQGVSTGAGVETNAPGSGKAVAGGADVAGFKGGIQINSVAGMPNKTNITFTGYFIQPISFIIQTPSKTICQLLGQFEVLNALGPFYEPILNLVGTVNGVLGYIVNSTTGDKVEINPSRIGSNFLSLLVTLLME